MAINLAYKAGPRQPRRATRRSPRTGKGRGGEAATIERALTLPEKHVEHDRPDRAAIEASLRGRGCDLELVEHRVLKCGRGVPASSWVRVDIAEDAIMLPRKTWC